MANSTKNSAWDDFLRNMESPSSILPEQFAPDSQPLDQMSFSDTGDLSDARDWFSSNLAVAGDGSRRRPSIQKSPSKALNDTFPPRRSSQVFVLRSEFVKEIRGLTEKVNRLQER
jgi:hypothetical protein